MDLGNEEHRVVAESQDIAHGGNHDYMVGSPHLRHAALRERLDCRIGNVISEVLQRQDRCEVLEIGAGHGSFTETVLAAGGTPTVTEMSKASFEFLTQKFRNVPEVRVMFDSDGNEPLRTGPQYDVILLISVLHHIPDYIDAVTNLCDNGLRPGGTVVTFQDPMWYPRQKAWARALSQGSYFAWRITQGEIRRGLATRSRRLRGVYDGTELSDLVEYHVVRQGVDDIALSDVFKARFADLEIDRYFSTQSPLVQWIGKERFPSNTFGIVARRRFDA
jgi:2-polyprenyl-3-methyl-5-hydroxy-6-metoxy-1,4-benzoquinol methylase